MEFIEASRGVYPSTTGFLRLLRELIRVGGCPADLGRTWRSQPGCSPYISYVIDLVLPRATGTFKGFPEPLPFRCSGDKDRLLSHGFDVVATCLRRYIVPDFVGGPDPTLDLSLSKIRKTGEALFSIPSLVDRLVLSTTDSEFKTYVNDYVLSTPTGDVVTSGAPVTQSIMTTGVPLPKSPGFFILCELLNRSHSSLLEVVGNVLGEGLRHLDDVDKYTTALATYGLTPPTISSAKGGNYALKNLLLPLRTMDHMDVQDAHLSRQRRIVGLLEVLCAAACRENQFSAALSTCPGSAAIVPIVKFQARPTAPDVREVQVSLIGQLLNDGKNLQSIVELIGYQSDDIHSVDIVRVSLGFLFYLDETRQTLPRPQPLVRAISRMIDQVSGTCDGQNASSELLQVVNSRVSLSLRSKSAPLLLNIPILEVFLQSMIGILNRQDFLKRAPILSATCYEVLYRAMYFRTATDALVACGFWTAHLDFAWSQICENMGGGEDEDMWYSIGWVFAGIAEELGYLHSSARVLLPSEDSYVLRPQRYNEIVDMLFQEQLFSTIVAKIPFSESKISELLSWASHLLVGGIVLSSRTFMNSLHTTKAVEILLDHLVKCSFAPATRNLSLAILIALNFQYSIAEEDSLNYVDALSSLISRGGESGIVSAATLAIIMHNSSIPDDELPQHTLAKGVSVLLRVSCATSDTRRVPVQPTPEARLARICLKTILPNMDESLVQRMLTDHGDFGPASTVLGAWIGLLASFDGDIVSLLHMITGFSFGSDMLLDGDILRFLDMLGERVTNHMQSVESSNLQPGQVGVPVYLQGHLELMTILLLRASQVRQIEAAHQLLRILSRYEPVAVKLFASFPRDGDTSAAYVKCCAIALQKAGSKQFSVPSAVPPVPALKSFSSLVLQILENPLPPGLLANLPVSLSTRTRDDHFLTIVAEKQKSWWDFLGRNDWNDQLAFMCSVGIQATAIANLGFPMMRSGDQIDIIDYSSIATGLCRSVDAVRVSLRFARGFRMFLFSTRNLIKLTNSNIQTIAFIAHQHLQSQAPQDSLVIEDCHRFQTELCKSIIEILRTAITRLKGMYETLALPSELADWDDVVRPLKVALDYTRLESNVSHVVLGVALSLIS